MRFDPQTGEPIEEVAEEVVNPIVRPKKRFFARPAFIAIASVAAVAVTAGVLFVSGVFLGGRERVLQAVVNTCKDGGPLMETLMVFEGKEMKESTTTLAVEYQGVEIVGEYRHTPTDKQIWLSSDVQPGVEAGLTITKDKIMAGSPLIGNVLLVYDYSRIPSGYIVEATGLGNDELEAINMALEMVYKMGSDDSKFELTEKQKKALKNWYKSIEVEKTDEKETFEIDGKDKKCAGYTMEIDEDVILDLLEICIDILDEAGQLDQVSMGMDMDLDDYMDELRDSLEDMPKFEVTFYVHANKLAAIIVEADGSELSVLFEGGAYRTQNICVEVEGITVAKIKGETDGSEETRKLVVQGETFAEYTYDSKNGDFDLEVYDYSGEQVFRLAGTLEVEKDSWSIDANVKVQGQSIDFALSLKKGADIEKMKGTEFNIGEASEKEWEDIIELFQNLFG